MTYFNPSDFYACMAVWALLAAGVLAGAVRAYLSRDRSAEQ